MDTETEPQAPPPVRFSIGLPADLYEILRTLAYEQRCTKKDLIVAAIRKVYGEQ
jgi:hypothetical protein